MIHTDKYAGSELELFAQAHNWKAYFRKILAPHIRGKILEVGAGIGGTTRVLRGLTQGPWTCLEPDKELVEQLRVTIATELLRADAEVGTLRSLPEVPTFDTILYIDVLEHIEHDAEELAEAAKRLNPGGTIVVLSPAHGWLFTPFDSAIGHFRRYNKEGLRALCPATCLNRDLFYLDSVGMLASGANRLLLKSAMPSKAQIAVWDRIMIPATVVVDRLTGHRLGKSIVATYELRSAP
ncbi:MAG: class I SAM-dependent methyltransferase [Polyangiaceae bacterium]|nr:class I SAM-dependent methyltransferase [Polyangiaceae bacterium]